LGGIERRTNYAVGTNYRKETQRRQTHDNTTTLQSPFIQMDSSQHRGPYWLPGPHLSYPTPDMKSYVLTKTHCANSCYKCDPWQYHSSFHTFDKKCRSDKKHGAKPYAKHLVSRMVRMVRDPLNNIVSRFHHARNENTQISKKYRDDAKGFHRFCKEQLHVYRREEERYFNSTILSLFQGIPCYADFYRFITWHNYAQQMVETYPVSSLLIYYEDYDCTHGRGNQTMHELLQFLNLGSYNNMSIGCKDFQMGKSYHDYYSKSEIQKIWFLIQHLSSVENWSILERYHKLISTS